MENYEENVTFEDILNQSFKKIKVGSTITGTIININNNKVRVTFRKLPDGQIKISDAWIEKTIK